MNMISAYPPGLMIGKRWGLISLITSVNMLSTVTIKYFHLSLHFITYLKIVFANLIFSGSYSSVSFTPTPITHPVSCTRVSMFTCGDWTNDVKKVVTDMSKPLKIMLIFS